MESVSLASLFGGLPFLDHNFAVGRFLAAVACVRRHHATQLGWDDTIQSEQLLDVDTVAQLRNSLGMAGTLRRTETTAAHVQQIRSATRSILAVRSDWQPFFNIPLQFHAFPDSDVISFSTYSLPQQLFLGSRAFVTEAELSEQIMHELTHTWTYMIEELWRFHRWEDTRKFRLPSGTADRTATEVLSAGYVAAVLIAYYTTIGATPRVASLHSYLTGCLDLVTEYEQLTDTGREVAARLDRFAQEWAPVSMAGCPRSAVTI